MAAGGIGDGEAVIAAGRRDDAGRGHLARQEIIERSAWLERSGMLQELEFQHQWTIDPERPRLDRDHRRFADVSADAVVGGFDVGGADWHWP